MGTPPAAADLLQLLLDKTTPAPPTTTPDLQILLDIMDAFFAGTQGVESRGDPITAMVGELTMNGDRHSCFGLFDGIVESAMGIAGPILGLGENTVREMKVFIKQSAREAEQMGVLEAISQIMAVTGVPIPDTCKCDCGCRASPTLPAAAGLSEENCCHLRIF